MANRISVSKFGKNISVENAEITDVLCWFETSISIFCYFFYTLKTCDLLVATQIPTEHSCSLLWKGKTLLNLNLVLNLVSNLLGLQAYLILKLHI